MYSHNTKVTIMLLPLSKLNSVAKLRPAIYNFNPVGWAELALIPIFTYPPTSTPQVCTTILDGWKVVKWHLSIQHLSKHHMSRQHLSRLWLTETPLEVVNISAVILVQIEPNLYSYFKRPAFTGYNFHLEICQQTFVQQAFAFSILLLSQISIL